jgi:AcrR family transcriptional regulator
MSSPEPLGRRDRKKAETREALRWAALELAGKHGYEQLTVEAITEAADVSVRTFFNYFTSKDDALLAPDPDSAELLAVGLTARPASEPPVVALRAVLGQLAESFVQREPLLQARLELVRANPALWPRMFAQFTAFERVLTEAVAARTGSDPDVDLYPGVVAAAVVGAMRVAMAHWRAANDETSLADLLSAAFDILAAGLAEPGSGCVAATSDPRGLDRDRSSTSKKSEKRRDVRKLA